MYRTLALIAALVVACAPGSTTPIPSERVTAPAAASARSLTSPSPAAPSWRGMYFGVVPGSGPLIGGGALQLYEAAGQLPGRVVFADRRSWGAVPPQWSPNGRRALLRDRELRTFVLEPDGSLTELAVDRIGHWKWYTDDELFSVHQRGGGGAPLENLFVRADSHTGKTLAESVIPLAVQSGDISPDRRWLAYSEAGPHRPLPAFLFEIATQRVTKLSDAGTVAGWMSGPNVVVLGDDGRVDVIEPTTLAHHEVYSTATQARAEPHSKAIVGTDKDGTLWELPEVGGLLRGPKLAAELHSISATGDIVSFTESLPATFPAVSSARAGIVNMRTGAVTYACERDCEWLAVR